MRDGLRRGEACFFLLQPFQECVLVIVRMEEAHLQECLKSYAVLQNGPIVPRYETAAHCPVRRSRGGRQDSIYGRRPCTSNRVRLRIGGTGDGPNLYRRDQARRRGFCPRGPQEASPAAGGSRPDARKPCTPWRQVVKVFIGWSGQRSHGVASGTRNCGQHSMRRALGSYV